MINKESYWLTLTLLHLEARHRPRDCTMFCIEKCKQLGIMVSSKAATLRMKILLIIPLILPPLFLLQMSHQIFFLAFSYTIVSTLSQLKKTKTKKTNFTLTYFMCCLKIIFLFVNASNLIIRIPFERKLKNAINKFIY